MTREELSSEVITLRSENTGLRRHLYYYRDKCLATRSALVAANTVLNIVFTAEDIDGLPPRIRKEPSKWAAGQET
jgi:hypothetical protein